MADWFEEIDLGITGSPVTMGVRGDRPWLFEDRFTEKSLSKELFPKTQRRKFFAQSGTATQQNKYFH